MEAVINETSWWGQQPLQGELMQPPGLHQTLRPHLTNRTELLQTIKEHDGVQNENRLQSCIRNMKGSSGTRTQCDGVLFTDGLHSCRPAWGSGESQECAELRAPHQRPPSTKLPRVLKEVLHVPCSHIYPPNRLLSARPPTDRQTDRRFPIFMLS